MRGWEIRRIHFAPHDSQGALEVSGKCGGSLAPGDNPAWAASSMGLRFLRRPESRIAAKELAPADVTGISGFRALYVAEDERSYAYFYVR